MVSDEKKKIEKYLRNNSGVMEFVILEYPDDNNKREIYVVMKSTYPVSTIEKEFPEEKIIQVQKYTAPNIYINLLERGIKDLSNISHLHQATFEIHKKAMFKAAIKLWCGIGVLLIGLILSFIF